jgi:hypothetical protein
MTVERETLEGLKTPYWSPKMDTRLNPSGSATEKKTRPIGVQSEPSNGEKKNPPNRTPNHDQS